MLAGLAVAAPLLLVWMAGGWDDLARWSAEASRGAQEALARGIRAVRAGEPGAVTALLAVAFGYGVAHAAGPGHGKLLIGGYAAARRVSAGKLLALSLAAALAQATVAVVIVYAGVLVFRWSRERMAWIADDLLVSFGHAAVAGLGLWLVWRGLRALRTAEAAATATDHGHAQGHVHGHGHAHGTDCTHAHGPTVEEAAAVTSAREATVLIAGVALRPCTGAIFLLVLTWNFGIWAVGVAGAYAMGLGTATITAGVALLALWAREGALQTLAGGRIARALPLVEVSVGLLIAGAAAVLLAGSL
jgi:ABC-type nickel/cobalt efflux system permease component RcnA